MAGKTIPDLDPSGTVVGTDQIPISQTGATKRATITQISAAVLAGKLPQAGMGSAGAIGALRISHPLLRTSAWMGRIDLGLVDYDGAQFRLARASIHAYNQPVWYGGRSFFVTEATALNPSPYAGIKLGTVTATGDRFIQLGLVTANLTYPSVTITVSPSSIGVADLMLNGWVIDQINSEVGCTYIAI